MSNAPPPPPPGFVLEQQAVPPPPPGFVPAQPAPAPLAEPTLEDRIMGGIDTAGGIAQQFGRGALRGGLEMAMLPQTIASLKSAVAPVPEGVPDITLSGAIARNVPSAGDLAGLFDRGLEAAGGFVGAEYNPEPRNAPERYAERIGEEFGTFAPMFGAARRVARVGAAAVPGAPLASRVAGDTARAYGRQPGRYVGRELSAATASGGGQQTAVEISGGEENTPWWGYLLGSMGGLGLLGAGQFVGSYAGDILSSLVGRPDIAPGSTKARIANTLIANSEQAGEQIVDHVNAGGRVEDFILNTDPLVDNLRDPSAIEQTIPGYRAGIGDRTNDVGWASLEQNQNARLPGASNIRTSRNNTAIGAEVDRLAPSGDPAAARRLVQEGVDAEIGRVDTERLLREQAFGRATQDLAPALTPGARGSMIRGEVSGAYQSGLDEVDELYQAIGLDRPVPAAPLDEAFQRAAAGLDTNDLRRFTPEETGTVRALAENGGNIPLSEYTSVRSGLAQDARTARAAGESQRGRVASRFIAATDEAMGDAIPPDLRAQYDQARSARADVGRRFEESNTGVARILRQTERGRYVVNDEAVPAQFRTTNGAISDYRGLMGEVGSSTDVREALTDNILAEVQSKGLLNKPERLRAFMQERSIFFDDFPELRSSLDQAGASREALSAAEQAAEATRRDLTTPSRSPEANYLRYPDELPRDGIRTILRADDPRAAAEQLVARAGGAPEARAGLRKAFWEELSGVAEERASDVAGNRRFNGARARAMLDDPRARAAAEALWADAPDDLAAIENFWRVLEEATPGRARAAGSSGTAQAMLSGPSGLTPESGLADVRSFQRGFLSGPVLIARWVGQTVRGKTVAEQNSLLDSLMTSVVNSPGMAADILENFNPADAAAFRTMMTQKYGVRAAPVLNAIESALAEGEEPSVEDAVMDE